MSVVNHDVKSFKAVLNLAGDGFQQTIEFVGTKCEQHADLSAYIASQMKPRLDNLVPGEVVALREQIKKLGSSNLSLSAEIKELRDELAKASARANSVSIGKKAKALEE